MEAQDYPIIHFESMSRLATALKLLPVQILEHQYSYQSFGSWSLLLQYKGKVTRLVYDGRDYNLSISRSFDKKAPYTYGPEKSIISGEKHRKFSISEIEQICQEIQSLT